jgi:hypothetical protein
VGGTGGKKYMYPYGAFVSVTFGFSVTFGYFRLLSVTCEFAEARGRREQERGPLVVARDEVAQERARGALWFCLLREEVG